MAQSISYLPEMHSICLETSKDIIVFTNLDYVVCSIESRAELLGGKDVNSANLKSDSLYSSQLIMHQIASKTSF